MNTDERLVATPAQQIEDAKQAVWNAIIDCCDETLARTTSDEFRLEKVADDALDALVARCLALGAANPPHDCAEEGTNA